MKPSASPEEAAAIVAAVERFVAETTPGAEKDDAGAGPWQRAALLEGVSAKRTIHDLEGGSRWLS